MGLTVLVVLLCALAVPPLLLARGDGAGVGAAGAAPDGTGGDGGGEEGLPAAHAPEALRGEPMVGAPGPAGLRAAGDAMLARAERMERMERRRIAAVRTWGVRMPPLRPPAPPEKRTSLVTEPGHISGEGLPPVITRVPTEDRVVFLTIDDGAEKDPKLLEMTRELEIPYTSFLSDHVARNDYDYFRRMRADGNGIHNHSINHREMPKLSRAEQKREICRQQDVLEKEIGERPTMFRPPYGAYDRTTLEVAAECGVEVVPLWAEEAFADRMEWGRGDRKFHPGDIILTHFRGPDEWKGTMPDMIRLVLDTATEQGFALARLEDYI
ncbi:polysaccharide deacetylase family protein [Streptomyces sp. ST2-7A]|uniref:polysaccharide deacetylase family protein n=1 Tax=Streptomyces sp. ST2-7A TaxID=2907214 RepID=UPI001F1B49C6|nr:polysaccharide deacetylase family protein [Streptomyces sp. ST2-7A]MCE7078758.1 polysaccharide deacetylase family protein [Streptomyces sp. ST2-7A]